LHYKCSIFSPFLCLYATVSSIALQSYAGGSVATGRATLGRQVKGEHPDKERYTGPPGWVDGPAPHHPEKKTHMLKNLDKGLEKQTVYLINTYVYTSKITKQVQVKL